MAKKKKRVFSDHERELWRPPVLETADQWAERCLVLPRGVSANSGPLSLALTPYLREILRAISDPETERVTVCTSSQVGKTTLLIIAILHFADVDPWNMMWVMPNEGEAIELKNERIIPIIKASPVLAKYLDDNTRMQLSGDTISINGQTITFRGSRSPSGVASKPIRLAAADEIDKWEPWTGKEGDPLDLVAERLKTFHDAKLLTSSTPTTKDGRIYHELGKSTNERYFVPCPHCDAFQILVFGDGKRDTAGIKWPEGIRDGDRVDELNLAWYECGHCHERIDEGSKRQMMDLGVWAPHDATVDVDGTIHGERKKSRHRGFHVWAAYSQWPGAGWSKCAAMFLKAKGKPSKLMNFRNSWQAEPWAVTVHELKENHLRARCGSYISGSPPKGARVLTVGVDVQSAGTQTYQYYVIRAWGAHGETWLVRAGISSSWDDLYAILFASEYQDQAGNAIPIEIVLVDSGYKTDEVYQFCELYGLWAAKGDVRTQRPYTQSETETAKGSDRWLRRVNVNSDFYKSHIHGLARGKKWHLPEDISPEYLAHMVAEQLVSETEKRTGRVRYRWQVTTPGRPNHFLDCEVLAHCGGAMMELGHMKEITKPAQAEHEPAPPAQDAPKATAQAPAFHRAVSKVFRR